MRRLPENPDPPGARAGAAERHAEVYATPMLPAFEHWKVAARIRAGRNPLTEIDVVELAALGVTHVLDLREPSEWSGPGVFGEEALAALAARGIARTNLPIPDLTAPTPEHFAQTAAWLDEVLGKRRTRLFAHCRAGRQRTATILTAWRAWNENEPFEAALRTLRKHGWPADPLPWQRSAAERWLDARRKGRLPPQPPFSTPP
jgi:rhodanese-related sulfurtransferase